MGRDGCLVPAGIDATDDDHVFIDHRKIRSPPIRREHPVLFEHRMFPDQLAGLAIEALKRTTQPQDIHAIGLGVCDDTGPSDTLRRCIREVDIVDALPDLLACLGVDANGLLGFLVRFGLVSADDIHPAIHDHWSRTRRELFFAPKQILTLDREARRQSGLERLTDLLGTSPMVPIGRLELRGPLLGDGQAVCC